MQRILRTLTIVLFALTGLSGCQSSLTNLVGLGGAQTPAAAPETAAVEAAQDDGFKASVDSSNLIFVVPVKGAGGPAPLVLADAVVASLRDVGKPAVLAEKINEMGPSIVGRIDEAQQRGSVIWATAVWELRAPYGTVVAEYRQQIVVDANLWRTGSAEAINLLVFDAGPRVAEMVQNYVSPMAMPVGMKPVVTDTAAREQAVRQAALREAAIRDSAAPAGVREPVAARVTNLVAAPRPQTVIRPVIRARIKGPTDQQAVAVLTDKVSGVFRKETRRKAGPTVKSSYESVKKSVKNVGRPRVLMKVPEDREKAPPKNKIRRKDKSILMPVPQEGPSAIVPNPPPVGWKRPSFLVKVVRGAPGDGNTALLSSMKTAMRKSDLTVTEDPRQAGFVIEGNVELSAAINGHQQARIVWAVNTVDGDEVGKAVQENAIKAGSLNGTWGRVADIVSLAAIAGIQELFGIERKQTSRSRKIKFTGRADMPRVPGRALPPP